MFDPVRICEILNEEHVDMTDGEQGRRKKL